MSIFLKVNNYTDKVAAYIKREGTGAMLSAVGLSIREWLYARKKFMVYAIDISTERKAKPKIDVMIRKATGEDMDKLASMYAPDKIRLFKERIKTGRICFIALYKDAVAGYIWAAPNAQKEFDGYELTLKEKEAFQYNSHVFGEFRRKGIFFALMCALHQYLREHGFTTVKRVVDAGNLASIASASKNDAQLIDTVSMVSFLGSKRVISENNYSYNL